MICLVDSGICNLDSVIRAFARVGVRVHSSDRPQDLEAAAAVVLPGVGAFGDAMQSLRAKGLDDALRAAAARGTPLLGICLGMQLLLERSEEHGDHVGLGLLPGRVVRLQPQGAEYRVPNIGWCDITATRSGVLFPAGLVSAPFYFVHSYHVETPAVNRAATIDFGGRPITVVVEHGNIFGVQFHPEKSQDDGLDLLARWAAHVCGGSVDGIGEGGAL